ncbi:hypothetical protein [Variovorax saccharolyticus]|uniref:hypothetical protein n=1 Tax=Variovorax saccharolyticus TaxID=3053516 RepID=UPI002576FD6B|nr:hypothetical protein [Variovorax sp. J22R187]MDM0022155.1 hypothetical protein [Variovorax sp. J22R187]
MDPNDFPLLRAAARSPSRLDAALPTIAQAVWADEIRNVALQEAKSVLSNAVHEAWGRYVNDRHFSGESWRSGSMTDELQDLYYKVNVYGLHGVHAAAKRVAATKAEGPAVDAMRAVLQELLPLAQAVTGLKDKIVKGRAPSQPRPPANPDQLRMSCGAARVRCPDLTELSVLVRERGVKTLKKITRDMPEWIPAFALADAYNIEGHARRVALLEPVFPRRDDRRRPVVRRRVGLRRARAAERHQRPRSPGGARRRVDGGADGSAAGRLIAGGYPSKGLSKARYAAGPIETSSAQLLALRTFGRICPR